MTQVIEAIQPNSSIAQNCTIAGAVVIATCREGSREFADGKPSCLLPLVNKPCLQHVLEFIARSEIDTVDLIVGDGIEDIRSFVSDGERWGLRVRYHLTSDEEHTYASLSQVGHDGNARLMVMHADTHPGLDRWHSESSGTEVTEYNGQWAGVAVARRAILEDLADGDFDREKFSRNILNLGQRNGRTMEVRQPLSVRSAQDVLDSQRRLLNGEYPEILNPEETAEPGVWIGRNTRIHPTAVIQAPVWIGPNCDLSRACRIGPNAVINRGCIVDERSSISESLILRETAIGFSLEVQDSIISGRQLFNSRIGSGIELTDEMMIGDLSVKTFSASVSQLVSRATAALAIAVTWPIVMPFLWMLTRVSRRCRFVETEVVITPASRKTTLWKTFGLQRVQTEEGCRVSCRRRDLLADLFLRIIPGLPAVVRGKVRLFGSRPRTVEQLAEVESHWLPILRTSRTGLIYESLTQYGPLAHCELSTIGDIWFASTNPTTRRFTVAKRYLRALFLGPKASL